MTIMPVTGIAMGYYGGNGLPFFFTTVPGIVKTDDNKATAGAIAKQVRVQTGWFWGDGTLVDTILPFCSGNAMLESEQSFQIHKQLGTYGKFLVPVHVGKFVLVLREIGSIQAALCS